MTFNALNILRPRHFRAFETIDENVSLFSRMFSFLFFSPHGRELPLSRSSPICSPWIEFFFCTNTRWNTFEIVEENVSSFARMFVFFFLSPFSRSRSDAVTLPPRLHVRQGLDILRGATLPVGGTRTRRERRNPCENPVRDSSRWNASVVRSRDLRLRFP